MADKQREMAVLAICQTLGGCDHEISTRKGKIRKSPKSDQVTIGCRFILRSFVGLDPNLAMLMFSTALVYV
jgi:hypothetical protein